MSIFYTHTKKYTWQVCLFVFFLVAGTSTELVAPMLQRSFFNLLEKGYTNTTSTSGLISILILLAVTYIITWTCWRVSELINNKYKNVIMRELSVTAYTYLLGHSEEFFNNNFVGGLVKKVRTFVDAYDRIASVLTWQGIPILINIVVISAVLWIKNIWLGIGVLIFVCTMTAFNYWFSIFKLKYDEQRTKASTEWTGLLADTITNQSNIKLFNGKTREVAAYRSIAEKVRALNTFTWNLGDLNAGVQVLIIIALEIGLMYIGIVLWKNQLFTIGDFVLIQSYVVILARNFWGIGRIMRDYYEAVADANEMTAILTTPHEIQDQKNALPLVVTKGKLEFKQVSFHYAKAKHVIKNLSLTIRPKERVAFVGASGAGKSTITKLLMRVHDVTNGAITIDDQPIQQITQETLWEHISLVPQTPVLFHRTLFENIQYGKPDATEKEVIKAAKLAHCHEFISKLKDGYNTYVGERGVKLSGGERQRVAIARAILKNSPILILDEATSSLDSESEQMIQEALEHLMKNKTVIVIAHRLSTIMKMDRIIVIENGMVKEDGNHDALLKKRNGVYKKLWKFQVGGFIQ